MVKDHSDHGSVMEGRKEMVYLTMLSTHFKVIWYHIYVVKDHSDHGSVIEGRKEMVYLMMLSTHFMVIWHKIICSFGG